jgi:hypothetical protein
VLTEAGRAVAGDATAVLNGLHFGTEPLGVSDLDAVTSILERLRADADGFPPTH